MSASVSDGDAWVATIPPDSSFAAARAALKPGHALPRAFYTDPAIFEWDCNACC